MAGSKSKKNLYKAPAAKAPAAGTSRRTRSGGSNKTAQNIKADAIKTIRNVCVEERRIERVNQSTHIYVGGLIPTVHPEHLDDLFIQCGAIVKTEYHCTNGTADLQMKPLPEIPLETTPLLPRRSPRLGAPEIAKSNPTHLYAIITFQDASSATRALMMNGEVVHGLEETSAKLRVSHSAADLVETRAVESSAWRGKLEGYAVFPSAQGLERKETEPLYLDRRPQSGSSELSREDSRNLTFRRSVDKMRHLSSEATIRPSQQTGSGGFFAAFQEGFRAMCGISFKVTIM